MAALFIFWIGEKSIKLFSNFLVKELLIPKKLKGK